jgi:hypothetical protein
MQVGSLRVALDAFSITRALVHAHLPASAATRKQLGGLVAKLGMSHPLEILNGSDGYSFLKDTI